jgi:hypothetical protein
VRAGAGGVAGEVFAVAIFVVVVAAVVVVVTPPQ